MFQKTKRKNKKRERERERERERKKKIYYNLGHNTQSRGLTVHFDLLLTTFLFLQNIS